SPGLTAICVGSQLVPPASEWRTKIRLSRAPSLPPAYHETSSEPSSSSMSDEPWCTAMAVSAETMLVLKPCARAMDDALRTKTKIAQILVEKRAFISFKGQFWLYRAKLMKRGELKSLSYNVKVAFFVTLQRFSFLIP